MGNYRIKPVETLDYNTSFYQPMRETVTNRCHDILKPIWPRTTYINYACGGKTALKEPDQNIRQFKKSQK